MEKFVFYPTYALLGLFVFITEIVGDAAIVNISYIREQPLDGNANVGPRSYVTYCAAYNPELSKLPSKTTPEIWTPLELASAETDLCDEASAAPVSVAGVFLATARRNCSAYEQGVSAQHSKAVGLLIGSNKMFFPGQPNITVKHPYASSFPILILKQNNLDEIEELPFFESHQISVYAVEDAFAVDGSGICLILIAVIIITLGSLRSGHHRLKVLETQHERLMNVMEPKNDPENGDNDRAVHLGSVTVVIFALIMTSLLVLMYFFYDYLVYMFIGLFVVGATSGCFECLRPALDWTEAGAVRIPLGSGCLSRLFGAQLDIRHVVLFLISIALSTAWLVTRNESFGWVLLDILGSFLLVSVLVGIQLPNLRACTLFLCLLFIYDIFFVFITPFLTKDGQSVMIQVATGGYDPTRDSGSGQREVIPAAFKIPHIPTGAPCENLFDETSYSLLGFGDVMVPGFLISYLRGFELVAKIRPVYSAPACLAYLLSLVVTTVALILMRSGQPALMYIVPIVLSTVFFIAWRRREVSLLWNGKLADLYHTTNDGPSSISSEYSPPSLTCSVILNETLIPGKNSLIDC